VTGQITFNDTVLHTFLFLFSCSTYDDEGVRSNCSGLRLRVSFHSTSTASSGGQQVHLEIKISITQLLFACLCSIELFVRSLVHTVISCFKLDACQWRINSNCQ
jgi:hypothetical protein